MGDAKNGIERMRKKEGGKSRVSRKKEKKGRDKEERYRDEEIKRGRELNVK